MASHMGFDEEELGNARQWAYMEGRRHDPMVKWANLVRLMPHRRRSELRGPALLAQDYYDIADMLGYFLRDLTGVEQKPTPDLFDGAWPDLQQHIYGSPIMSRERKAVTRYLGRFGLVPQPRVALLTEGETERAFVNAFCKAVHIDLAEAGVWHHSMEGAQKLGSSGLRELLGHLKWDGTAVFVHVDNDEHVDEHLADLVRANLLCRRFCTVWDGQFEEEFPIEQISDAIWDAIGPSGLEERTLSRARAIIDEVATHCADTGLSPFREPLRSLHIHVDRYKPEIGKALGISTAARFGNESIPDLPRPVQELSRVMRAAQASWDEWSGFREDWPPHLTMGDD